MSDPIAKALAAATDAVAVARCGVAARSDDVAAAAVVAFLLELSDQCEGGPLFWPDPMTGPHDILDTLRFVPLAAAVERAAKEPPA